jgi:hypothetical protein
MKQAYPRYFEAYEREKGDFRAEAALENKG